MKSPPPSAVLRQREYQATDPRKQKRTKRAPQSPPSTPLSAGITSVLRGQGHDGISLSAGSVSLLDVGLDTPEDPISTVIAAARGTGDVGGHTQKEKPSGEEEEGNNKEPENVTETMPNGDLSVDLLMHAPALRQMHSQDLPEAIQGSWSERFATQAKARSRRSHRQQRDPSMGEPDQGRARHRTDDSRMPASLNSMQLEQQSTVLAPGSEEAIVQATLATLTRHWVHWHVPSSFWGQRVGGLGSGSGGHRTRASRRWLHIWLPPSAKPGTTLDQRMVENDPFFAFVRNLVCQHMSGDKEGTNPPPENPVLPLDAPHSAGEHGDMLWLGAIICRALDSLSRGSAPWILDAIRQAAVAAAPTSVSDASGPVRPATDPYEDASYGIPGEEVITMGRAFSLCELTPAPCEPILGKHVDDDDAMDSESEGSEREEKEEEEEEGNTRNGIERGTRTVKGYVLRSGRPIHGFDMAILIPPTNNQSSLPGAPHPQSMSSSLHPAAPMGIVFAYVKIKEH